MAWRIGRTARSWAQTRRRCGLGAAAAVVAAPALAAAPCVSLDEAPNGLSIVYPSGHVTQLTALPQTRTRVEHFTPDGALTGAEITLAGAFLERATDPSGGPAMQVSRAPDPLEMLPFEPGDEQTFQATIAFSDGAGGETEMRLRVLSVAEVVLPALDCAYELALLEYAYPTETPDQMVATYAYYAPALRANLLNNVDLALLDPDALGPEQLPAQIVVHE